MTHIQWSNDSCLEFFPKFQVSKPPFLENCCAETRRMWSIKDVGQTNFSVKNEKCWKFGMVILQGAFWNSHKLMIAWLRFSKLCWKLLLTEILHHLRCITNHANLNFAGFHHVGVSNTRSQLWKRKCHRWGMQKDGPTHRCWKHWWNTNLLGILTFFFTKPQNHHFKEGSSHIQPALVKRTLECRFFKNAYG